MKIMVNGGHFPGLDPGAIGRQSEEALICRELMELTAGYLMAAGMEAVTVQENELADIVAASNMSGADLFLSIHCNASKNPIPRGTETYYYSDEGKLLAACVQQQIVRALHMADRGVKPGRWLYVLRNTEAVGILVETAFISNAADELLLREKTDAFARAIARGVTDYESDCVKE